MTSTRRSFLRTSLGSTLRAALGGASAAALAGPLLRAEALGATISPRRLILIFTPNGIHAETRCSKPRDEQGTSAGPAFGTEHDFTLGPYYKALEPLRDRMIAMSRLTWAGPEGWGHNGGSRGPFNAWKTDANDDLPKGASVDQFIAGELVKRGQLTLKRNVHFGIGNVGASSLNPFWSAPGVVAVPTLDPGRAFADLFGAVAGASPADKQAAATELGARRKILDRVSQDCDRLLRTLGPAGRDLVDLHCQNLRSMSATLAQAATLAPDSCKAPRDASAVAASFKDPMSYPALTEYFFDLITGALSCDLTRVAAFQFGAGAARLRLPFLGLKTAKQTDGYVADDHHTWTHHAGPADEKTAALTQINGWYSTMIAGLVNRLTTTKDAFGQPLIDSTAVLWLNEYGTGCATGHDLVNIPGFLFTGKNELRTGRFLRMDHKYAEHKALLTSMCHFMGLRDVRDFGYNGPLRAYDTAGTAKGMLKSEGPLARLYG
jgi:hypothetical protein